MRFTKIPRNSPMPYIVALVAAGALFVSVRTHFETVRAYRVMCEAVYAMSDRVIALQEQNVVAMSEIERLKTRQREFVYSVEQILVNTRAAYPTRPATLVDQINTVQSALALIVLEGSDE